MMRIAVITGASSGIGREFARQIPRLYHSLDELWVVARRTDRLKELVKESEVPVRIFDGDMMRDYIFSRIEKELERYSADIRMLVNAAGYGKIGAAEELEMEEQCGMIDLNCRSLTKLTLLCLPYMTKGSRIINIRGSIRPAAGICRVCGYKILCIQFFTGDTGRNERPGHCSHGSLPGPRGHGIL